MNPLIGITCGHQWSDPERFYVNGPYIHGITAAGGIPILVPYLDRAKLEQILDRIDALLVPGGIDVDAKHYNQELHPKSGIINPWWDELDIFMIRGALARNLPLLAICRGCQILNVACGGSLIQDIESFIPQPIKHQQQAPKWYPTHGVTLVSDSHLAEIYGTTILRVNSFHHQAVDQVAPGFRVTAVASDGVIEGIESIKHRFVVGVQWHPELMVSHDPAVQTLFARFTAAAAETNQAG